MPRWPGTRRTRVAAWAIVRERGEERHYYRGPMFPLEGQWVPDLVDAVRFSLRRDAATTQSCYIDRKIDQTRIVPVWEPLTAAGTSGK